MIQKDDEGERLDLYVRQIQQYREQQKASKKDPEQDLAHIIRSLGYSEDDVRGFEASLDKRRLLAQGYVRHELYAEALTLLQDLIVLKPQDEGIATSYFVCRYKLFKQNPSLELYESLVSELQNYLLSKPDHTELMGLLAQVKNEGPQGQKRASSRAPQRAKPLSKSLTTSAGALS